MANKNRKLKANRGSLEMIFKNKQIGKATNCYFTHTALPVEQQRCVSRQNYFVLLEIFLERFILWNNYE